MPRRKAITKKARFEVFKRDSFKCQYCGRSAPDVLLRVDHIHPVSKGGDNDIINLITACFDCNSGKSDVLIDDKAAIVRQREQLEALNDRRSQLEMLLNWRDELRKIEERGIDAAAQEWRKVTPGYSLTESGRDHVSKLIRKYGLPAVLEAMDAAKEKYVQVVDGKATLESADIAYAKLGGICYMRSLGGDEQRLHYIRGICRNRFDGVVGYVCLNMLKEAAEEGANLDGLEALAKAASTWFEWKQWMLEGIDMLRKENNG